MMNNILEVKNLSKKYNDFELKNVSFELPKGMILGFIGKMVLEKLQQLSLY